MKKRETPSSVSSPSSAHEETSEKKKRLDSSSSSSSLPPPTPALTTRLSVSYDPDQPLAHRLRAPTGIAFDPISRQLIVADSMNNQIYWVSIITERDSLRLTLRLRALAGGGGGNTREWRDGRAGVARFHTPSAITLVGAPPLPLPPPASSSSSASSFSSSSPEAAAPSSPPSAPCLLVADTGNRKIRSVTLDHGRVSTVGGNVTFVMPSEWAKMCLRAPCGVAMDSEASIVVSDRDSHRISAIAPNGEVRVLAGGVSGSSDGVGISAQFDEPHGLAIDHTNSDRIYVADRNNSCIRTIDRTGGARAIARMRTVPALSVFPPGLLPLIAAYVPDEGYVGRVGERALPNKPIHLVLDAPHRCLYYTHQAGIHRLTFDGEASEVTSEFVRGVEGIAFDAVDHCLWITCDDSINRITLPR